MNGRSELSLLTKELRDFRDERNWSQFHTLRNLIVSLNLEAAELLELTQWKSEQEVSEIAGNHIACEDLRDECADILLYLLLIADRAGFDLADAARRKLVKNRAKYPVEKCYGSSKKYTEFNKR